MLFHSWWVVHWWASMSLSSLCLDMHASLDEQWREKSHTMSHMLSQCDFKIFTLHVLHSISLLTSFLPAVTFWTIKDALSCLVIREEVASHGDSAQRKRKRGSVCTHSAMNRNRVSVSTRKCKQVLYASQYISINASCKHRVKHAVWVYQRWLCKKVHLHLTLSYLHCHRSIASVSTHKLTQWEDGGEIKRVIKS